MLAVNVLLSTADMHKCRYNCQHLVVPVPLFSKIIEKLTILYWTRLCLPAKTAKIVQYNSWYISEEEYALVHLPVQKCYGIT